MKFDRDVIKGVLEVYFTEHLVEELLKDMSKSQHELNTMRMNKIREFVERNVNRPKVESVYEMYPNMYKGGFTYVDSDSMKVGDEQ